MASGSTSVSAENLKELVRQEVASQLARVLRDDRLLLNLHIAQLEAKNKVVVTPPSVPDGESYTLLQTEDNSWNEQPDATAKQNVGNEGAAGPSSVHEEIQHLERAIDDDLWTETEDKLLSDACDAESVYMMFHFARNVSFCGIATFLISVVIQLIIPAALLQRNMSTLHTMQAEIPTTIAALGCKSAAAALFFFLCSGFTTCIDRACILDFLSELLPGRSWALSLGAYIILFCTLITSFSTLVLFVSSPRLEDILLNSLALNFLPDADCQMTRILSLTESVELADARRRVQRVKDFWPASLDRQENMRWWRELGLLEKLSARPRVALILAVRAVTTVVMVTFPIVTFIFLPQDD